MRTETCTVELNIVKVIFTAVAMMLLDALLLILADPIYSWWESMEVGRGGSWLLDQVVRLVAIFAVSFVSGVLLARDRWLSRVAATGYVLWLVSSTPSAVMYLLGTGRRQEASIFARAWMIPLICVAMIAFLFSPVFHDCGRVLRNHLQNRTA